MKTNEPIYVTKPFLPPYEEFTLELRRIWDSYILTNFGPIHGELLENLKEYLIVENLALFVNGHQALENAISTLNIQGEVITTPFTFASTTHAIVRSGLTPVFCDIRPDNYNIDEEKIENLITEKTSAILPVHVYGTPCDVEAIAKIAKRYNLKVVYDAAHAFGVRIGGRGIGSYGDISMFSFHATKVFNTIEGGALVYSDPSLGKQIYLEQNFGIANAEEVLRPGTNSKMNEFQALMGLVNLKYVDGEIQRRKIKVRKFRELIREVPGVKVLEELDPTTSSNYAYFPVLISEEYGVSRDELVVIMQKNNIFPRKYFYPLVNDFACYRGKYRGETPIARYVAERILCLPIWGEISDDAIDLIFTTLRNKA